MKKILGAAGICAAVTLSSLVGAGTAKADTVLGLAGRAGPARSERPRSSISHKSVARVAAPEPVVVEEDPVILDDGHFATVLTINDRMCRWPIGDPAENEFHFCGRKPRIGSPYCEAHARKAYQPQPQRRDRRAAGGH